jgi:hypothetical protein
MQVLAGLACLFAALLQLAVYRSPDIVDNSLRRKARRIVIVGLVVATMVVFHSVMYDPLPNPSYLVMGLLGLSQLIFAVADLLPHLEKEHPQWTSHLTNLP